MLVLYWHLCNTRKKVNSNLYFLEVFKLKKHIFPLFLALILMLSCSSTAFAASSDAHAGEASVSSISSTEWSISGPYVGYTFTSRKSGSFTYGITPAKMRIRVDINVDAPVSMFIQFFDSDGKSLDAASYTITKAGTTSWNIPSIEFGPGSYKFDVFFSRSDVYCIYSIYGVTVG